MTKLVAAALPLDFPLQAVDMTRCHDCHQQRDDERAGAHREQSCTNLTVERVDFHEMPLVCRRLQRLELVENLQNRIALRHDAAV